MISRVGKDEEYGLRITGMSHTLEAMHVDGERWIGMLHIDSPSDAALLEPQDVLALRDWLNHRLLMFAEIDRAEHDMHECDNARRDGYLADLCEECYLLHARLMHVQPTSNTP